MLCSFGGEKETVVSSRRYNSSSVFLFSGSIETKVAIAVAPPSLGKAVIECRNHTNPSLHYIGFADSRRVKGDDLSMLFTHAD